MTARFILTSILTINIIALLTLIFFVAKNLFKLYVQRRDKVPGYRFRSRLVAVFMILILIPSISLFIISTVLSTNYINRLFSMPVKESLTNSVELAREFYDLQKDRVLNTARQISKDKEISQDEFSVIKLATPPDDAGEIIKEAFEGKEGAEVVSNINGDIVRAAVPSFAGNMRTGIIVVELRLPQSISVKSEKLRAYHENLLDFQSFRAPLSLNYVLILSFITLLMIFTVLWVSLKMSQGITDPIQSLAIATREVASGNLNVSVNGKTDDEIGILINSFNQMVKDLKDNKDSLETAYAESDKRRLFLENILDNINSGVIFLDNNMTISTINKAACSILNINQEDFVGRNYKEFLSHINSGELNSLVETLQGQRIINVKKEIKLELTGKTAIFIVYISGIWDPQSDKSLGLLVVFNDITKIIAAQKAIAWQEFASKVAHEIKNPLTPIRLSTERLIKKWKQKSEDFDSVFEKSTNLIIYEVDSLRNLVDVFSKYGKMPEIKKEPVDLGELLKDFVILYSGFRDILIQLTISQDTPIIQLDREQFKRALINIADNAIQAMNRKGVLKIDVKRENEKFVIEIADTGVGIPDDEKEKLFQPYFSKRKGGTGLGLAIAAKVITDHGGHISIRDNIPHGAVFVVRLPID
jgi:two-component system nitrogen regulation sensor histidine kinase NtrY